VAVAEAYLYAKFRLDLSNRLATIHQRYRQDRTDRQRSDSIGRTILQTVAKKREVMHVGRQNDCCEYYVGGSKLVEETLEKDL